MAYSVIALLAVIIHVIINFDFFHRRGERMFPAARDYRLFLFSVIIYHVTDALWGVFHAQRWSLLLYSDTVLYFAAMALSVLLWARFVLHYLGEKNRFGTVLYRMGLGLLAIQIAALLINSLYPIVFYLDAAGEYHALGVRYATLGVQIVMFLLTSAYTLIVTAKSEGAVRLRHLTVGLFGLEMIAAIIAQLYFPLLPLYSIGYLIGGCVLHTFVVEDEKAEYLHALAESRSREAVQRQELDAAMRLAYTDSLTGVKSKHAHVDAEERLDQRIASGEQPPFAVAVFDLNGLKDVNDTRGHETGDRYIVEASGLIRGVFRHSPIYRIGGDEFVAVLEGQDYEERAALMAEFEHLTEQNRRSGRAVVASGIAEFEPQQDNTYGVVFNRADAEMYWRKRRLKEVSAAPR